LLSGVDRANVAVTDQGRAITATLSKSKTAHAVIRAIG